MDYREEKNIIKSMLNARCREGTTVEDIIGKAFGVNKLSSFCEK